MTPRTFVMSAICWSSSFENFYIPKYTPLICREDSCDGGVRPKSFGPFGYHTVGCKIGTNAIRQHDEVVFLLAKLFRSLYMDGIVEPSLFLVALTPTVAIKDQIYCLEIREVLGDK